ncbi:protein ImuA [Herbaspirillum sp. Sphag1AN]|uniref:translesion DNA synthesis-associated protein ImuA n=1 Tax=unclassified Herbaspirillum TaxID=2624150 RepID=UPI0016120823|nr:MULTISPECIES: translesion DNA synthesis-associated protein ImuA [unclassified Herbaspirillum]MBB3213385.1 protein ImuA [Herbaspirillum sp. Sphag1AN]MBB3246571.1 protein ImuA [Herbaspirillum sp. Sphag64]
MPTPPPQSIHSALWLASQLARSTLRGINTGFPALSAELPEQGWPTGVLIDLLLMQEGIGELRLLAPALRQLAPGKVALIQAPHLPQILGWHQHGIDAQRLLSVRARTSADASWAAEQILKSDTCAALLLWQRHLRRDSLRRLHLAAQGSNTLFMLLRPLSCAQDASPAPLRLSLTPRADGLEIGFLKRRGPQREQPLFLPLPSLSLLHYAPVDRPLFATTITGSVSPELVR